MKWFDTDLNNIKEMEKLNKEQIDYLQKPSLTIFGPFNILVRGQWDVFFGVILFNYLANEFTDDISFLFALLLLAAYIWLFYFAIIHGRRLAWNRNNWKSFDSFVESEKSWQPWGVIFFVIFILVNIGEFVGGYNSY